METNPKYRSLLSPGSIGKMELKNRMIEAGMGTSLEPLDGTIDDVTFDFYVERAKGGVALIVTGVAAVDHPHGLSMKNVMGISDDKYIPGLKRLAEAVHQYGCKLAVQLQHGGKVAMGDYGEGMDLLCPSEHHIGGGEITKDMASTEFPLLMAQYSKKPERTDTIAVSKEQIAELVRKFAEAAERCKKAGVDGVEIHAAHGYLIAEFLSPAINKRDDEYGGDVSKRARFLVEIITAIREKVGRDYPVWCRIDAREWEFENGITIEDTKRLVPLVEAAGVDAVHVSGYGGFRGAFRYAPLVSEKGFLADLTAEIKSVAKVPVIAVGRIDAELGERLLNEGKADFIAMARSLLADPQYPNKVAAGREEDITPCIMCYNCVSQQFWNLPVFCAVNPACGKEEELRIKPADKPKKVMVVGSGPGGMEAARVATLRGHKVTIYEKGSRLGGALFVASMACETNEDFLYYLTGQINKLGIEVKMGVEVTPQLVDEVKPDVVIVANGGSLTSPDIPGKDRPNVLTGSDFRKMLANNMQGEGAKMLSWWQKLGAQMVSPILPSMLTIPNIRKLSKIWLPIGKRVVIVGGDIAGVELAEFLAARGREVTVIEELDFAAEMAIARRWTFMDHLRSMGVNLIKGVRYKDITDAGLTYTTKKGEFTLPADTIVITGGMAPNTALYEAIKAKVPQTFAVGDCRELRLIHGSVEDGYRAALAI